MWKEVEESMYVSMSGTSRQDTADRDFGSSYELEWRYCSRHRNVERPDELHIWQTTVAGAKAENAISNSKRTRVSRPYKRRRLTVDNLTVPCTTTTTLIAQRSFVASATPTRAKPGDRHRPDPDDCHEIDHGLDCHHSLFHHEDLQELCAHDRRWRHSMNHQSSIASASAPDG